MDENLDIDTTNVDIDETTEIVEDTIDVSNLTEADYFKEKARREKAEKLLVELKKQTKELKAKVPQGEYITKTELELEKLIEKDEELSEYRDEILAYTNKGLSVKEATVLVKASDKAIENRKKQEQMSISGGETASTKTTYSADELEKLSQKDYNLAMARIEKGEAKLK